MSRKRCKRKVWPLIDPVQHAKEGAARTPRDKLDRLLMLELVSLDAFARGAATLQEWKEMVTLNNLTQTLCTMGVKREAMPHCHQAESGLVEAARRFERTGKMGLSGPALQALREVIEWHDAQRSTIPRRDYEEAIRLTGARIKSGHATIDLGKLEHV